MKALPVVLAAALLLAGCGGYDPKSDSWKQTWKKKYDSTTCYEYLNDMTKDQARIAAGNLLAQHYPKPLQKESGSGDLVKFFGEDLAKWCPGHQGVVLTDAAGAVIRDPDGSWQKG